MVFTREKNNTSNQNRERCFFTCEKNNTSNQKPQRCYPASRGYIFAVLAGVRKVASADKRSNPSRNLDE